MKKRTKREKIIRMMSERPELSLKEIAEKVGVNPQYVYTVKWEKKSNSNFVSKVFEKAGLKKKPTIGDAVKEIKTYLDARELMPKDKPDLVNNPPHYKTGGVDFLDYAEAKNLTENAYLFNVVKYVSRAGKKVGSDPVEDLKKAEFYLKREIARRQSA